MKKEAQRIAIAEACGWINTGNKWNGFHCWSHPDGTARYGQKDDWLSCVPDYLHDLNAMHEAEKVITDKVKQVAYAESLITILNRDHDGEHRFIGASQYCLAHATAAQRAEAFLRTLCKWEEEA